MKRRGPGLAVSGVAASEVSGPVGEFADVQVGDVLGQQPPWPVEAGGLGRGESLRTRPE